MGGKAVRVFDSASLLAAGAAGEFARHARAAATSRGLFRAALAGGQTPRAVHRVLSGSLREEVPWSAIRFGFGDERCVPPDDPRSNYGMARETLFEPMSIASSAVLRMEGEMDPAEGARRYQLALAGEFGAPGIPRFDFLFLGLGEDGHTASLFPQTTALAERRRLTVENWVSLENEWRLTLTYPVINAASRVVFVVSGKEKAPAVARVLAGDADPADFPAAGVAPSDGELLWLLDRDAAAQL
ncbi:MAG TPA: 6-phosphogluconolactonase [Thermoanaerobaculia bacterium]|jgi:6-phosphogluconolactonase